VFSLMLGSSTATAAPAQATVSYFAVDARRVCSTTPSDGQSRVRSIAVTMCPDGKAGDLELVTLGLDATTEDVTSPTGSTLTPSAGWTRLGVVSAQSGSGGNKPILLYVFGRIRTINNNGTDVTTFSAPTQYKWAVNMVTFRGVQRLPQLSEIQSWSDPTGNFSDNAFTTTEQNSLIFYVFGNSFTGNIPTPSPNDLTLIDNFHNNAGGVSTSQFIEVVPGLGATPQRSWTSNKSPGNSGLIRVVIGGVRP